MTYPIYLDYAASTPVDQNISTAMLHTLQHVGLQGNPSSLNSYGQSARDCIERAREQVAKAIGAHASEIIWTSGATEANNLAIKGIASLYRKKGNHIVTCKSEHKAVLDVCQHLQKNGYRVTYLYPKKDGSLDLDELEAQLTEETVLVSIMHVNNETGVINDIGKLAAMTSKKNIFLHVDAAQSVGKLELNLSDTPVDLMSLSAHKTYGPKGIGALYLRKRPRVRVEPLLHGGGHEQGLRSGTLATHQIVGMGEAFALAHNYLKKEATRITALRQLFLHNLAKIPNLFVNAPLEMTVPHILNIRFENMLADNILAKLPQIAASTASACQGKMEGSYVLRAMGLSTEQVKSSIRFSFGRFTTEEEITQATNAICGLFRAN